MYAKYKAAQLHDRFSDSGPGECLTSYIQYSISRVRQTHAHGFSLMTCLTAAVSRGSTEDEILLQLAFHDAFNRITLPSQV